MASTAQIIGRRLAHSGIKHAFGIPGGEVLAVIDGLNQAGIDFTLVKHENPGGFMAEGTFHASGAPGVLIATLGPGVANAINVIANAQQDRVPLLFITGCVDAVEAMTYTHQIFDHQALLQPITKASIKVPNGAVEEAIDKAISIAMDDPPGPVHIDVPISVATTEQPDRPLVIRSTPDRGTPSGETFEQARQWLTEAQSPLILAGVEALHHHAEQAIKTFVLDHNIPLITSYKAKGIVDESDPLCLGGTGLSPKSESILLPLVAEADLIILAGYDPIEMRAGWRNAWSDDARVIELSAVPNTHYMHQSSVSFNCDVNNAIQALGHDIEAKQTWPDGEIARTKTQIKREFSAPSTWGPGQIIETARRCLPDDTVATVDTGAHRILLSQMWTCPKPRLLLQSSGLCTMGVAVPIAAGYKRVNPNATVVAFCGDAGMEMVLGDLATVRDLGLPLIIILFIDESLALIELKQRGMGLDNMGVDFGQTNFQMIGDAYGFHSEWVDDQATLETEISAALQRDNTTLLSCRFPRKAYDGTF